MKSKPWIDLPIAPILDKLQTTLAAKPHVVLQAPPGAGKTTGIPLFLREVAWLNGRKIVILAPRRLAARAAAMRMSNLLGEKVGQTVGYRVRMDSRVSPTTRIEVVTEGVLTRMLQSDPSLEGVGLVIFDEFHERSLEADLGLALCLDIQGVLNVDLRVLIMSATMDTEPIAALLDGAPVLISAGREFPVETRYVGRHTPVKSIEILCEAVLSATHDEVGSILVFLPGASEIRQAAKRLTKARLGPQWIIAPLFGNLTHNAQNQAIAPPPSGQRKIVLSTSIAETSLTIESIRVVVDSGLQRRPRFEQRSGMTRLVTVPVSQAAADQRRGRAGRMGPGVCLRLWSREIHPTLVPAHRPEILEADLTGLVLELAFWGVHDPAKLKWLDPPPQDTIDSARSLLKSLGALDPDSGITEHGRQMAAMPMHPRLAHMLVAALRLGHGGTACDLAALLGERDVVRFYPGQQDADIRTRIDLVQASRLNRSLSIQGAAVEHTTLRRVIRTADQLRRRIGCKSRDGNSVSIGRLLAWAYPDRIARRRPGTRGKFLLTNGRGAYLDPAEPLAAEDFIVAAELDGKRREARIFKAAAYSMDILTEQFAKQLRWKDSVDWDSDRLAVTAQRELLLGALTLRSERIAAPESQQVLQALLKGIRKQGLDCLPWTKPLRRWQERVCFLRRFAGDKQRWPDVTSEGLESQLTQWLAPYLNGMTRLRELNRVDLKSALYRLLTYQQHHKLDEMAPTHLTVPSGSRIPIDYSDDVPVLAVRLQEMFGLAKTPSVAGGRQPLLIHLLSPAGRPAQITQDLAGFWQSGYHEVKKEMKGRYPKHYWPDDPLQAQPTARVKPKIRK